ncbi:unnamed protein product [Discosporangium mesarthrocarpum]
MFSGPIKLQGITLTWDLLAILTVYFVQGAFGLARLATTFFLKDELHLPPAEVAALAGLFNLPWVFKPLYGFLSDGLPIFGYRRRSYMGLAGLVGSAGWFYLAMHAQTPFEATLASIVASLGIAVSDVVADSIVVEKARKDSLAVSGGLQSLCWGAAAIGGIISAYFSGALLQHMTTREVFSLTALLPLLITGFLSFILRSLLPTPVYRCMCCANLFFSNITVHCGPYHLPIALSTCLQNPSAKEVVMEQAMALWSAVSQKSVWLPALFIFLWQATPSSDAAFFYFLTNDIGIGPEFLGRVRLGSSIATLAGVWIFQNFLKEVKVSRVLLWSALISVPLGLTQLLLVSHANRALGIPDELFTFGDDVILTVLGQIAFMPVLVLAARICPPGIEGTLFALLMSIFNGGTIVGSELGALLTRVIGVTDVNFTRLGTLIVLCNLSSLLPLPFLKWIQDVESDPSPKIEDGK